MLSVASGNNFEAGVVGHLHDGHLFSNAESARALLCDSSTVFEWNI